MTVVFWFELIEWCEIICLCCILHDLEFPGCVSLERFESFFLSGNRKIVASTKNSILLPTLSVRCIEASEDEVLQVSCLHKHLESPQVNVTAPFDGQILHESGKGNTELASRSNTLAR